MRAKLLRGCVMRDDSDLESQFPNLRAKLRSFAGFSDGPVQVSPLAGDGSDRRFFRVRQGRSHLVALVSPRKAISGVDENDSYFLIGKHLYRLELPVPRFFWSDPGLGLFLMEDLGDFHLQRKAEFSESTIENLYGRVLRLLIQMHRKAPDGFQKSYCFDTDIYDPDFIYLRELEYFRKAFLVNYSGLEISAENLREDFQNLAEAAGSRRYSFVIHRDFQSRNILIHRGSLRLLDFQGMRYGPPEYDLASLMLDPYVSLPLNVQKRLVELYWSRARDFLQCSHREFHRRYRAVRLCRNLQVLGAYGYLGIVKRKKQFLRYVPGALKQLSIWINGPCRGQYPELQELINGVIRTHKIDTRLGRKFC